MTMRLVRPCEVDGLGGADRSDTKSATRRRAYSTPPDTRTAGRRVPACERGTSPEAVVPPSWGSWTEGALAKYKIEESPRRSHAPRGEEAGAPRQAGVLAGGAG